MISVVPNHNGAAQPLFFNILSQNDKEKYLYLMNMISNSSSRHKRYKKYSSLIEIFNLIHFYCIHNDSDDWKRCLICGICWIDHDIAINIRQLSLLTGKCKSSINGTLSEMGYISFPINDKFLNYIPILKDRKFEAMQWNIRKRINLRLIEKKMF